MIWYYPEILKCTSISTVSKSTTVIFDRDILELNIETCISFFFVHYQGLLNYFKNIIIQIKNGQFKYRMTVFPNINCYVLLSSLFELLNVYWEHNVWNIYYTQHYFLNINRLTFHVRNKSTNQAKPSQYSFVSFCGISGSSRRS